MGLGSNLLLSRTLGGSHRCRDTGRLAEARDAIPSPEAVDQTLGYKALKVGLREEQGWTPLSFPLRKKSQ